MLNTKGKKSLLDLQEFAKSVQPYSEDVRINYGRQHYPECNNQFIIQSHKMVLGTFNLLCLLKSFQLSLQIRCLRMQPKRTVGPLRSIKCQRIPKVQCNTLQVNTLPTSILGILSVRLLSLQATQLVSL